VDFAGRISGIRKFTAARHLQEADLQAEFWEVESGKSAANRPQLQAALEMCKRKKQRTGHCSDQKRIVFQRQPGQRHDLIERDHVTHAKMLQLRSSRGELRGADTLWRPAVSTRLPRMHGYGVRLGNQRRRWWPPPRLAEKDAPGAPSGDYVRRAIHASRLAQGSVRTSASF